METLNPYASNPEVESFEEPPRTGKLAIASLVCGLVFLCPLTTLLAPILGLAHFITARGKPWVRGAGLAIGGILLGLVMSGGWVFMVWVGYKLSPQMMRLPEEARAALAANDVAEFRARWSGLAEGSEGDAQIVAFRQDLESRYGSFDSLQIDFDSRQNDETAEPPPAGKGADSPPFLATFTSSDGGSVKVPVIVTFMIEWSFDPELKIRSFEFVDAERGNVVFPGPEGTPVIEAPNGSDEPSSE